MTLRRRALCCLAALSTALGITLPGVGLAVASPSITAVSTVPSAPLGLTAQTGVDGVSMRWFRGSVTADAPTPWSYLVRRRAEGHNLNWVVSTDPTSTIWSASDTTLPVGLLATYTVAAISAAGVESAESEPASATVPAWQGPYTPALKVLTMVWDEAEAVDPQRVDRATTQVTQNSAVPLTRGWENDLVVFSSGPGARFALARDMPDGEYTVGQDAGQLNVSAVSGAQCSAQYGASGSASVHRTAPSMSGGYASITVDAALVCGDGHRLQVELRWSTPDGVHAVSTAPLTVIEASPGEVATREVTVSNTGSLDATLGAARLIDATLSTGAVSASVPLTVTGSTCEARTLTPGESCAVSIRYTAGLAGSREGNGILVLRTDLGEVELGRVVGQQTAFFSGPQNITVAGSPGRVDLSWNEPSTLSDTASWRIEEDADPSPTVLWRLISPSDRSISLTGLGVGVHSLRVVMLTNDGREISSAWMSVTVPRRWLLVATKSGVRAWDPDGGHTDGGLFGSGATATETATGVAFSSARDRVIVSKPLAGMVDAFSATGSLLRRLTSQPGYGDDGPAVSPDGARVIVQRAGYTGSQTRDSSLVLVPANGGTETVVPRSAGLYAPSWTPDGTAVLTAQISGADLVEVTIATGARTLLPGTKGGRSPAVSRTGRVAYVVRVGVVDEIRLTSLTGGTSTRLGSHNGLYDLDWDPTGRWLAATGGFYGSPEHTYVYDTGPASPTLVRTLPGGLAVAWLDTSSMAPIASLVAPAWSTRTASLTVGASDSDDAVGGLRRECRLDTATTWTTCGSTWSLSALALGQHTAYARVTDPSGKQSAAVTRSWSVEAAAPTAALGAVPSVLTGAAFTLTWTAADSGGSGLASYDVRERHASSAGRFGGYVYPAAWQGLRARSLALRIGPGYQYCFSTRARDLAGNVGAWSAERCTAVAFDDRAMSATSGWTRGTSASYAYGTWSRAARSAVSLSRGSVQGRRLVLVVTTCPTCGTVDVYHAGIRLGRVSLYSAKAAYRQLRWLPHQSVTRTGTVVVRTTSSKGVYIDGVAVFH